MRKHSLLSLFVLSLFVLTAVSTAAHANQHILYECVDANGNKQFTNIPTQPKACRILSVSVNPAPASPAVSAPAGKPSSRSSPTTPSDSPRVDAQTQNQRDSDRRRILAHELGNEQKLLDQARAELAQQESIRDGTERNYQRVLDRLEPFKRRVKLHEDNVANLQREMANLR